ncbi:MAG: hypothetical protein IJ800_06595 [Clostridia bacterium]|nr:hypothetical protein [Clostridia bacterium]
MKKLFVSLVSIAIIASTLALSSCGIVQKHVQTEEEKTAYSLNAAVSDFVKSDDFKQAVINANSTQARLPISYLHYVRGKVFDQAVRESFETVLDYIRRLLDENDKIDDSLFDADPILGEKNDWGYVRWQSTLDYLFTFSIVYDQYKQSMNDAFTKYDKYLPVIKDYLTELDASVSEDPYAYIGTAWGFQFWNVLPMTAYNLGYENATPVSDAKMLSYYEKDGETFTVSAEQPNWNGFSGRPLASTLYINSDKYSVKYEKTMQGYYPKAELAYDDWSPSVEKLVTLDELYDNYDVFIGEWNTYDPQFAILTALAHGLDVRSYKTESGETKDILSLWLEDITVEGEYKITTLNDMAVALSYSAFVEGVKNPTPLGLYSTDLAVIKLDK